MRFWLQIIPGLLVIALGTFGTALAPKPARAMHWETSVLSEKERQRRVDIEKAARINWERNQSCWAESEGEVR